MRCIWLMGIATILILLSNSVGLAQTSDLTGNWTHNTNNQVFAMTLNQIKHEFNADDVEKLKIMSNQPTQSEDQIENIRKSLEDLGFSQVKVEKDYDGISWNISTNFTVTAVSGQLPKDLTPGNAQTVVWVYVFPDEESANLYFGHSYAYQNLAESYLFHHNREQFILGSGSKALVAASGWSAYDVIPLPPNNKSYPFGYAEGIFACGNIVINAEFLKAANTSDDAWGSGVNGENELDAMDRLGNESIAPLKKFLQVFASALQANKVCQTRFNIAIKASKDGYVPTEKVIDNSQNFERIELSGNVTDNSTGMPIKDAKVEIVAGANNASTSTDANGNYAITAVIPNGSGSDTRKDVDIELIPSQYIVGVSEITPAVIQLIDENGGTIVDQIQSKNGPNALLVNVSKEKDIDRFLANVGSSPLVKYVELNGPVYAAYVPNDPLYPLQWGPPNIRAGGLPNPSAWDTETGDKNVSIAIVDTGIQYKHQDLYFRKDGSTKYIYGYDWVDKDDDPSPVSAREIHGTHCTGIATAVMDNGKGIAGIAPNCSFMAERVLSARSGNLWDVSRGITDAVDQNADIISMSLTTRKPS